MTKKEQKTTYYLCNRSYRLAYFREYYSKHKEEIRLKRKEYYSINSETIKSRLRDKRKATILIKQLDRQKKELQAMELELLLFQKEINDITK